MVQVQPGMAPVRLYRGPDAAARELADTFESRLRALLPYHFYGRDDEPISEKRSRKNGYLRGTRDARRAAAPARSNRGVAAPTVEAEFAVQFAPTVHRLTSKSRGRASPSSTGASNRRAPADDRRGGAARDR
jgi:hypothetical protein